MWVHGTLATHPRRLPTSHQELSNGLTTTVTWINRLLKLHGDVCCLLTVPRSLVWSWARDEVCVEFLCMLHLGLRAFLPISQKHSCRWIGYTKSLLGVTERMNSRLTLTLDRWMVGWMSGAHLWFRIVIASQIKVLQEHAVSVRCHSLALDHKP